MSIPLNYASPRPPALAGVPECRRVVKGNDEWLVMQDGGSTPDRCICCNEPAGGYLQRVKYPEPPSGSDSTVRRVGSFGHVFGVFLILVAVVQMIVTLGHVVTRRTWVVHFAVCEKCRRRARRDRWLAVVAAILGLALMAGAIFLSRKFTERSASPAELACGAIGLLLLIVAWLTASLTHLPELDRIAQEQIWFKQVEKKFLESLPMLEPPGRANARK